MTMNAANIRPTTWVEVQLKKGVTASHLPQRMEPSRNMWPQCLQENSRNDMIQNPVTQITG